VVTSFVRLMVIFVMVSVLFMFPIRAAFVSPMLFMSM